MSNTKSTQLISIAFAVNNEWNSNTFSLFFEILMHKQKIY